MLAIVIPYYKIDFFEETLLSLSLQTNKSFTVYVGNDNSPDDCSALIEKYLPVMRIKLVKFDDNLGSKSLASQWHRCYQLIADEKWIMFLGDDDLLSNKCIEEFYRELPEIEALGINVVRYSSTIINAHSTHISTRYEFPILEKSTSSYIRKAKKKSRASLSEHIFRRSAFQKIGFADLPEGWHADDLIILEVSKFGLIYTINSSTAYIRYSEKSVSGLQNNVERKNKATKLFILHLICNNMHHFNRKERYFIIWYYSKKLRHAHQLTIKNMILAVKLMIKNAFSITPFLSKNVAIPYVLGTNGSPDRFSKC